MTEPLHPHEWWFLPEGAFLPAALSGAELMPPPSYTPCGERYPTEPHAYRNLHRCRECGRLVVFEICLACHPCSRICRDRPEYEIPYTPEQEAEQDSRTEAESRLMREQRLRDGDAMRGRVIRVGRKGS